MPQQIQTDNSCLEEKIILRLNSLEKIAKDTVNVLECFGGDGVIWGEVKQRTTKKINTLRIDLKEDKKGIYLKGNNLKYLASLDLKTFDIVDLDAYGSPFQQLQIIFKPGRGALHIYTVRDGNDKSRTFGGRRVHQKNGAEMPDLIHPFRVRSPVFLPLF